MCSIQPATLGIPPFCMDVLMYPLLMTKLVILSDFREKKILPSTFSKEIVLNFSTDLAPSSFGIKTPSASLHVSLMTFLFHNSFRYPHSSFATFGHLL